MLMSYLLKDDGENNNVLVQRMLEIRNKVFELYKKN